MKENLEPADGVISGNVERDYPDYLHDESRMAGSAASISFPKTEEELRDHLAQMRAMKRSVTVQGMRTGLTGGAAPAGGHVLCLNRMNRILGLRYESEHDAFFLTLQPGVLMREQIWPATLKKEIDASGWPAESLEALEEYEKAGEWFFPPDPSEPTISIGGMAANNSSGTRSFLYGPVRNYVERLRVVLADGSTVELGRGREKARGRSFSVETDTGRLIEGNLPAYEMPDVKNSAGYFARDDMDLIDLFVGSEGTLGIFSEIEVRLARAPGAMWGVMVFLPSEEAAVRFVKELRSGGTSPAAIEFLDCRSLELIRQSRKAFEQYQMAPEIPPEWHTAVYVEYHGPDEDAVESAVMEMSEKMVACGGDEDATWVGSGWREIYRFKQIRHLLPEVVNGLVVERQREEPGITKLATDLAVPDDRLEELMALYHEGLDGSGFEHLTFGHIGENNVHVNIIPRSLDEYEAGWKLFLEWARSAVRMGGTVSAEHGIGRLKRPLLKEMYGEEGVGQMLELKRLFDPEGLLNPGNLFAKGTCLPPPP